MTKHAPILALLVTVMSTSPAFADKRIVWKDYDSEAVVTVSGRPGIQTTIQFEQGERIENVAIGDSAGWQVTPNRRADLLFLKPVLPDSRTNMTVVTDRRTYLFDLMAGDKGRLLYVLRFAYRDAAPPIIGAASAANPQPPGIFPAPAEPATPSPADLNFAWERNGTAQMQPEQVYDDGRVTYLRWPAGAEVPAILVPGPDGKDGPINYAMRNDVIVLDGVPKRITLRNGRNSASLTPVPRTSEGTKP